jgi:DNA replication and repair protein RecF
MIKSIHLKNIRSFTDSVFKFEEGINLIVGDNGSGKTTLMESVGLFAFGRLLSVEHDALVVRSNEVAGRIEAEFYDNERSSSSVGLSSKEKIVEVAGARVPVSNLIGLQPQIFFNPETVDIVAGSPVVRRREMDVMILEIDHKFVTDLLNYKKILKERNMLLRRIALGTAKRNELDFWDEKLANYAIKIYKTRIKLLDFYNQRINDVFKKLSDRDRELKLKYIPSCDYGRFREVLVAKTESDAESGSTSVGPHRDDFTFMFSHHPMREGASRGEQRLAAVAYKALGREYLLQAGIDPIIILDDVFSELDQVRRSSVAKVLNLSKAKQVIISATDEKVIPDNLMNSANVIKLN